MDSLEITDFLDTQQTGVLSLARENDGYAIPLSFAYEENEQNFYLRLGYGSRSTKREFVDAVDRASFLVYDHTDDGWKSVLARGYLDELSETTAESAGIQAAQNMKIPYFQVHGEDSGNLEFTIVRMDVTELTGIISGGG
jgi:nitroimidazol reductase NimA-like FMN-containing flavoprotein (pyridoxamine 5'-phosphate oxidase superfamily)